MKMTLAKALNLKNKLAHKITTCRADIIKFNQREGDEPYSINLEQTCENLNNSISDLVAIKAAIDLANAPVKEQIYRLAEIKGQLSFWGAFRNPKQTKSSRYDSKGGIAEVQIENFWNLLNVDPMLAVFESELESIQDLLAVHNAQTTIELNLKTVS